MLNKTFTKTRQAIAVWLADIFMSIAARLGKYTLINPGDSHGIKNAHLIAKGNVICIPFYFSGEQCQIYLPYNRRNFDSKSIGILYPDNTILDITTNCIGLQKTFVEPALFGENCKLIVSHDLEFFPSFLNEIPHDVNYTLL